MGMAVLGTLHSACCQSSVQSTWQASEGLKLPWCNKHLSAFPAQICRLCTLYQKSDQAAVGLLSPA